MADAVAPVAAPAAPVVASPAAAPVSVVPAPTPVTPAPAPAATPTVTATSSVTPEAAPAWAPPPEKPKADAAPATEPAKVEEVKYDIKPPKDLPKELGEVLPAAMEQVVSFAKEHKLSPEQAQAIFDRDFGGWQKQQQESQDRLKSQNADWYQGMKKAWGDKFGERSEAVKRGYDAVDPDGSFRREVGSLYYDNHPMLIEMMERVGRLVADDKLSAGTIATPQTKDNRSPQQKFADALRAKGNKV